MIMTRKQAWRWLLISALAILFIVALWPQLMAAALLNYAQVRRLSGVNAAQSYQRALRFMPDNLHLRLQTGQALVRAGNYDAAVTTLFPLAGSQLDDANLERLLTDLLIVTGKYDQALEFYMQAQVSPTIGPDAAAALLLGLRREPTVVPTGTQRLLLAHVLRLDPQGETFQRLADRLFAPEAETSPLATALVETLTWQAACFPAPASSVAACATMQTPVAAPVSLATGANMLELSADALQIGPELITNGDFELTTAYANDQLLTPATGDPTGWLPSLMASGNPWNLGAFVVGLDASASASGKRALRIDGLIVDHRAELEPARAGLLYPSVTVESGVPYIISFYYRTEHVGEVSAALWLSDKPQTLFAGDYLLPPTAGVWMRVTMVAWNRSEIAAKVQPLLRSFSVGSVWFDAFSIRQLSSSARLTPREPLVVIEPGIPTSGTVSAPTPSGSSR